MKVTGTGIKVETTSKYNAEIEPMKDGDHLWVYVAMFRAPKHDAMRRAVNLDAENLLTIEGPGCYRCGATQAEARDTPCPGDTI